MTAGNEAITDTKYEQLLGIKIDHEFKFNEHVIWKKASAKINAVTRITFSITFDQGRLIMNKNLLHLIFQIVLSLGYSIVANWMKE